MTLIKKSPKKQSHLKTLVARRKARLAAETAFKSQEFVESDSEPEPENEAAKQTRQRAANRHRRDFPPPRTTPARSSQTTVFYPESLALPKDSTIVCVPRSSEDDTSIAQLKVTAAPPKIETEELPTLESVPEDDEYNFATLNDESDGFDIAAYEASIAKIPECTEEGFGEHGYDGLWLWYSEIEKFKSTTLAEFLKAREVPKQSLVSHTSYVGGRWFIPTVENNLFLSLYYRDCIRNGAPQFISERQLRWRKFRFIVDWDMEVDPYNAFLARNNLKSLEFDRQFAGVVLRSIGHLLPGHARLLYAKNPVIPNKVHIYFPSLLVKTADMGKEWLALIQDEFIQTFSVDGEDWDKIFDRGVLKNGSASLRMMGSQNDKRNGAYKPLDLITGQFAEITTMDLHDTILRTEIHMNDSPYKESEDPQSAIAPITPVHVESLRKYAEALAEEKPFPSQSLKFKDAKPGFFDHSFVVDLEDQFCSIVNRPHNRSSTYMYLLITQHGTWLKCYNSECHGKNIPLKDAERPSYIADLFPKEPEIVEDICGGGDSGCEQGDNEADEETAVELPKKRKKAKSKKKRAAQEDKGVIRDLMESPALHKSVLETLYNDEAERYQQPNLTDYLNKFIAYIHQNDTYGFRLRDDEPFDICKKAVVVNKMERFEIKVSPFNIWCKNENRREFTNVVFDTSDKKYPPSTLNLFCGYKAKMLDRKVEAEEVETFLYHLREVICRGHEENYEYYLRWWAWFFQKGRTGVMIILLSELKGTGKNIFLELLAEHVIGDKYVAVTDKIDTVVQRFNAVMVEKALIVANELKDISKSGKESSRVEEVLKTLVKERTTAIEKKGIDPLVIPSTANFHATSQYQVPLKIDRDQRRFVLFDVSPHKKGDFQYFETLAEFVKNNANEIFTYLNQIDLTGWGPEKNLVQTEYTKRAQKAFVKPVHQFWYDSAYCDADFEKNAYPTNEIYKQYQGWALGEGKKAYAKTWFGRELVSMGYTIQKSQVEGDRVGYITGKMSDATKEQMLEV